MPFSYGSTPVVSGILQGTAGTETSIIERLSRALTQAEALINNALDPWTTVPVAGPPQILVDIANDWAAGIIHDETTNPTEQNPPPNIFIQRAKENLAAYMTANGWVPPADIGGDGGGGAGGGAEMHTITGTLEKT